MLEELGVGRKPLRKLANMKASNAKAPGSLEKASVEACRPQGKQCWKHLGIWRSPLWKLAISKASNVGSTWELGKASEEACHLKASDIVTTFGLRDGSRVRDLPPPRQVLLE